MDPDENEYMMVCARFGQDGHQLHKWPKLTEERVNQAVKNANHSADMHPEGFYNRVCAPYVPMVRPIVEWVSLDNEGNPDLIGDRHFT